ncbi:hypothetical protein PG988_015690 [Apiospora saccharicola]
MCKYYAHAFVCQHTTFTFARYCTSANFTQKPCEQRQIWHTIGLDEACDECQMWFPDQYGSVMPRSKTKGLPPLPLPVHHRPRLEASRPWRRLSQRPAAAARGNDAHEGGDTMDG